MFTLLHFNHAKILFFFNLFPYTLLGLQKKNSPYLLSSMIIHIAKIVYSFVKPSSLQQDNNGEQQLLAKHS